MRLANLAGRSTIVSDEGLIDIATRSNGAFSASLDKCLHQLGALRAWYESTHPIPDELTTPDKLYGDSRLGPIVSAPQQIFAVGINYRDHAEEMNHTLPNEPMIFTKFASALTSPNSDVSLPSSTTDYEAELVVVVGESARDISASDALSIVAGYCVGQDYSERALQMKGQPAQFSLAKSFRNFAPIGPWLTTSDEIADPNALTITCRVNNEKLQDSSTSNMVFDVATIISYLSRVVELRTGDLIFTGTPHGVGQGRTPPVFLKSGDVVVTQIERLGQISNVMQ
jgi:2,4-diketo-3-deoxy-L-fuconate hydrolase